ncbi:MAG: carbohydrate kinase [Flavobacteriaceae bacterium]|nr:carbohydrate kinase [Flavobacteriaceae bacterium]
MSDPTVICFGEILWDIFPDREVIGGAPLNVALRLHSYGVDVAIISRIGSDAYGLDAMASIQETGMSTQLIQTDDTLETGKVEITLDTTGGASYQINQPVAWDAIKLNSTAVGQVRRAPFFVFGTLAVRGSYNIVTLRELLEVAQTKIFDVNLRAPHYNTSMVYELMQIADFIKLNDEELVELCADLGCNEKEHTARIQWLLKTTNTEGICVTMGEEGAMLFFEGELFQQKGIKVSVVDTVGAGDSFLATLIYELFLNNTPPKLALQRACVVGGLVASKKGANCQIDEQEIVRMLAQSK